MDNMQKLDWIRYGTDYVLRNKTENREKFILPYSKRRMVSFYEANDMLLACLQSDEKTFAGRLGFFELATMRNFEFHKNKNYDLCMEQLYNCAGFFPNESKYGEDFLNLMKGSIKECDMLACNWQPFENYFINKYMKKDAIAVNTFDVMEPWRFEKPWTSALEGKKVLVVHPFEDTIKNQYEKRDKLFIGTNILPKFELITYKALQTTGDLKDDRFETWFEALDFMSEEISKIDFDVALLGCGAYGFPLAARIKANGKSAIHMGGVLQLLFGIMGKRWDGTGPNSTTGKIREDLAPFYNEFWTYPLDSETPKSASKVEYGPYWK